MKKSFRTKKLTALFLCFALLFPLCSIGAFGLELPKPKERPVIPYALRDCEETETFVRRLPGEEKDLDTIVFLAEEGKRAMYLFSEPVKYVDENGETVDKDLTLVKTDGGYTAKANDIALLLPERLSDGVSLSYNGNGFALRPTEGGEESAAELTKENTVLYPDAFGAETALRYTPVFSGFKEDILLYRNVGKSSFSFTLISDTLVPFTDEAGALFFCDRESGEPLFRADDILCHDAKDYCFTGALTAEPAGEENVFLLTVSVDPAILDDPELAYPVTVDPSITVVGYNTTPKNILDATLAVNSLYSSGTSSTACADNYTANRSYILVAFPALKLLHPFQNFNATVNSATLKMTCSSKGSACTGTETSLYTGSAWTEASVPTYTGHTSPSVNTSAPSVGGTTSFNVTSLLASTSMNVNQGVFIRALNSTANGYIYYYTTESSYRPRLEITYTVNQIDDITDGCIYMIQNTGTEKFVRASADDTYLTSTPNTSINALTGGIPLDQHLFYIYFNTYYHFYVIKKYTSPYCYWAQSYSQVFAQSQVFEESEEVGWYIIKTSDSFKFIPLGWYTYSLADTNSSTLTLVNNDSNNTWNIFLSVNAINIKQQQINSCSAASLLQLLYSIGMEYTVSGSTVEAKEATLIHDLGLEPIGDYYPDGNHWDVWVYLRDHSLGHTYDYDYTSSFGNYSNFANAIKNSLSYGSAVIGMFDINHCLSYYPYNLGAGHFFSIAGINIGGYGEVLINDCTYVPNNPPYNGLHVESIQSLYNNTHIIDYALN